MKFHTRKVCPMIPVLPATRRSVLFAALLLLAACTGNGDRPVIDTSRPLTFDYLTPLRLAVGNVTVVDEWHAPNAAPNVDHQASVTPLAALHRMVQDRLLPGTVDGTATVTIQNASITAQRTAGGVFESSGVKYDGTLTLRVDVRSADGLRTGFATAQVTRTQTLSPAPAGAEERAAIDAMVRQMMNDMNVELEYQMRRSLRDWLQADADPNAPPTPEPVQEENLGRPQT